MNVNNLWWIIPICFVIGFMVGAVAGSFGSVILAKEYPVVECIYKLHDSISGLPFDDESVKDTVQWRCAKEYIDFNSTGYDELLVIS